LQDKAIVRLALGNIRMVVKKHKMLRDVDGNLTDQEEAEEGWDMYVLSAQEKQALKAGKCNIQGPAMIWLDNTNQVYFIEDDALSAPYTINQYDHHLKRLFNLKRNTQGKVIVHDSQAIRVIYRITREVARQTQKPHRFSPEYVFAHEFSLHYNEFAQYFPELGRLRELSKATALIRLIESQRLANQEEIDRLTQKFQDNVFWQNLETEVRADIGEPVNKNFNTWKKQYATNAIRAKKQELLNTIRRQIGTVTFRKDSPEVKQVIDHWYEEIKDETINKHGYTAWNRESWRVKSSIIEPQLPDLIKKLNSEKFNSVFKELKSLFKEELVGCDASRQIITDFIYDASDALLEALVAYEELQIQKEIQKVYSKHTLNRIGLALNGSSNAIKAIITEQAQAVVTKNKEEISKQIARRNCLDKTFIQMGLTNTEDKVDLTHICLWVPASVQHQVGKGNSRMVYGGVHIAPKIALMQTSNIERRLLSQQVFGAQSARVNSAMVSNARPPQVMNQRNAGGMGANHSNPPPSAGGGSGASGGGAGGSGGRQNVLLNILKTATPTANKPNQLEANLPNGTKVLFRRDIGEYAHPLKGYPPGKKIDHYNVEMQVPTGRNKNTTLANLHIVVNDKLEPIGAFTTPMKKESFNVENFSNKNKS
jgi:hypothetical protein